MTTPLIAAALWAIIANLIALTPSRRGHWPAAWVLIVTGIPILGWVTVQHGPLIALPVLAAGASVLRWPVIYMWRWIKRTARRIS